MAVLARNPDGSPKAIWCTTAEWEAFKRDASSPDIISSLDPIRMRYGGLPVYLTDVRPMMVVRLPWWRRVLRWLVHNF